jgi:hypothetical protein
MTDDRFCFNGIDGATGEYLQPPLTPRELVELLEPGAGDLTAPGTRRVAYGIDPKSLASSGWGVVFARGAKSDVRQALEPLFAHRKAQVGSEQPKRFRIYAGDDGYQDGESSGAFMSRHGVGPGPVKPDKAPYYLLLVGGPDEIPYHVQYELDLAFALGRVSFDSPEGYARYAEGVIAAESGRVERPRRVGFLASAHDPATRMSCHGLVRPLAKFLEEQVAPGNGWEIETHLAGDATRGRFARVLGGDETPALAFTATHGVRFPAGDPRQREEQGAFLCPRESGGEGKALMGQFGAPQVTDDAAPAGLVSLHFACYGAGYPAYDDFAHPGEPAQPVAPAPLVAALPQRLLGHPRGGALAYVGHVDRAWGWSFVFGHDDAAGYHREVFESTLAEILDGYPVGAALEYFGERHGQLAAMLAAARQRRDRGETVDDREYADLLTATHDARNYVLLGDPAVRLAVEWNGKES